MDIIKVVCGIINKGNRIFVCRRRMEKSLGGYWEFPGGKVNEGESEKEALKRELIEELEMEVKVQELVGSSIHDYGKFKIELVGYNCSLIHYSGLLKDHDAFEWVTLKKLLTINLAPADIPLAMKVQSK